MCELVPVLLLVTGLAFTSDFVLDSYFSGP